MPSSWSRTRAALAACAFIAALIAPSSAQGYAHLNHVNEVATSAGGDSAAQFVELMDPSDESFPNSNEPYKIVVFDAAGTRVGATTLNTAMLQAFDWTTRPYLVSTAASNTATGQTGDQVLDVALPTSAGQVCFTSDVAETKIHCVAYGCVSSPVSGAAAAPAPADGSSIQRQADDSFTVGTPTPKASNTAGSSGAACTSAPVAVTKAATAVGSDAATANGTVDPNGVETTYHFEFGTTTSYGSVIPNASAGSGSDPVAVTGALAGLTPSTTYHFRLVAVNSSQTSHGTDMTFTTTAAGTPGGGTTPPPGAGTPATDTTPPVVTVSLPAKRVIKNLLALKFKTNEPGSAVATVKLAGKKIGSGKLTYSTAGTKTLKLKLTRVALKKLRKKKGFTRVTVRLVVSDVAGNKTTVTKTVRIRVSR